MYVRQLNRKTHEEHFDGHNVYAPGQGLDRACLLARRNSLYVTRVVDPLCSIKPGSEDETFWSYLDPKVKGVDRSTVKGRAPFRGGGCLSSSSAAAATRRGAPEPAGVRQQPAAHGAAPGAVLYGCTELLNAEGFLAQLSELGRRTRG